MRCDEDRPHGDFAPVDFPYGAAIVFTRTFKTSQLLSGSSSGYRTEASGDRTFRTSAHDISRGCDGTQRGSCPPCASMPSALHEILVELFRNCGELAPELLRICARIDLPHDRLELTSIDLSQVVSTEYRADFVVELRDRGNATVAAVIVEVQLGVDADKRDTWPVYVTALRAKLKCPVILLVVTPDRAVARWARRPIELGHPGFRLEPVVIGFDDLPRITDPAHAQRLPELAVLSAMAHPELDVAATAIHAIARLPEEQNRLYLDTIMAELPDLIRQLLEARMQGYQYRSEFARRYYNQGREEGLRDAVLALARTRLEVVTADDQAMIEAVHDERALTELIDALARAQSPSEARTACELVVSRFLTT